MPFDKSKYPDDPRIREAASKVCRIAAWIEQHHPGRGTVLAFSYDYKGPDGGTVHLVDVFKRNAEFRIDCELSRLATRAAWALGWPLPSRDIGLPLSAPDHRLLSNHERLTAIHRIDAALAAASQEILDRPIRPGDELRDADMDDYDLTSAWLDYLGREWTTSMVVEHDPTGPFQRRISDITAGDVSGAKDQPTQLVRKAARVGTMDEVSDPALIKKAATGLVAVGRRHTPAFKGEDQVQEPGSGR